MKTSFYQEALDAYANPWHEFIVEPLNSQVNPTYKVTSKFNGYSFVLQEIDQEVFREPVLLQSNYELLWEHLRTEKIAFEIPEPKYFPDNTNLYCDSNDKCWRVFEYIYSSSVLNAIESSEMAQKVAVMFGNFTKSFEDLDTGSLHVIKPGHHDLTAHFNNFRESLSSHQFEKLHHASEVIEELKKREHYTSFYDVLTESEEFISRVTHHEARLGNVLFDEDTMSIVCPINLDFAMPGYYLSDLGELIRTLSCTKDADSTDLEDLNVNKEYYNAVMEGYLLPMSSLLTEVEKRYVHFSGIMMTYLQALRFMTDYLEGNNKFNVDYRTQNYDRSKNQLTLLKKLENFVTTEFGFKI